MKNIIIGEHDAVGAVSGEAIYGGDPPSDRAVVHEQESGSAMTPARPTRTALMNGWRRKCPNCGSGPLMSGYLQVRKTCPVCREELHHHRADDGPAYLTILIVGHLMAPLLLVAFTTFRPEPLVLFTTFAVGTIALSLYLLPRLKGAIVAYQWARLMHGFGRKFRMEAHGL